MKLGRRNLLYSLMLAGVMLLLLIGYFIYMLPSLYVEHIMEQNLKSIREQHVSYVKNRSYRDVQLRNSTACFSMEIPKTGNAVLITGKAFTAKISVRDERLYDILERFRKELASMESFAAGGKEKESSEDETADLTKADFEKIMEDLIETLQEILGKSADTPAEVRLIHTEDIDGVYFGESVRYHYYDGLMIVEANISDANNQYTNYVAAEQTDESIIISYLPVVTPQMDEIRPVVIQSLPMLGAVLLLLVLLFSGVYSRGIVAPVVALVHHTEEMKLSKDFSVPRLYPKKDYSRFAENSGGLGAGKPFRRSFRGGYPHLKRAGSQSGNPAAGHFGAKWLKENFRKAGGYGEKGNRRDEIRELADTLDDFYRQIGEGYRKLEEENRHQEIFLRASSHQLKTPIAASLLLVDGMINEIGRYKDVRLYLPRVKEQLLSMRKMVEDILYLNHCAENIQYGQVELGRLAEEGLGRYRMALAEKGLRADLEAEDNLMVYSDAAILLQILDNLFSNAVKYTPEGGQIRISAYRRGETEAAFPEGNTKACFSPADAGGKAAETSVGIKIENFGTRIPEELLPHIFEPFVSGGREAAGISSHGLGLYIAAFYAGKLGVFLSVSNGEDSVVAELRV